MSSTPLKRRRKNRKIRKIEPSRIPKQHAYTKHTYENNKHQKINRKSKSNFINLKSKKNQIHTTQKLE